MMISYILYITNTDIGVFVVIERKTGINFV